MDTGATRSIVQRANLEGLDLDQLGSEWLTTVSSGTTPLEARVFAVELFFAGVTGGVLATNLRVLEVEDLSGFGVDMLLGQGCARRVPLGLQRSAAAVHTRLRGGPAASLTVILASMLAPPCS